MHRHKKAQVTSATNTEKGRGAIVVRRKAKSRRLSSGHLSSFPHPGASQRLHTACIRSTESLITY